MSQSPGGPAWWTGRPSGRPMHLSRSAARTRSGRGEGRERRAGLQQSLEVAEDPRPAAAALLLLGAGRALDHRGDHGGAADLVGDREPADAVAAAFGDLVGEPGEAF